MLKLSNDSEFNLFDNTGEVCMCNLFPTSVIQQAICLLAREGIQPVNGVSLAFFEGLASKHQRSDQDVTAFKEIIADAEEGSRLNKMNLLQGGANPLHPSQMLLFLLIGKALAI